MMQSAAKTLKLVLAGLAAVFLLGPGLAAQGLDDERELQIEAAYEVVILARFGTDRGIDEDFVRDVERAVDKALEYQKAVLVLEIDSGGGRVDSARSIVALIRSHRESERLRIMAWVPRQAYSAAAWIAFACRGLIIAPDALIGDIQPLIQDFRGYERAPEKIVSPLTEEIRLTCQDNGLDRRYPRLFLEAMVDRDIEITRVTNRALGTSEYMRTEDWAAMSPRQQEGLSSNVITLPGEKSLTTNGRDLLDYGFAVKVMKPPVEKIIDLLGTPGATLEELTFEPRKPLGIDFDFSMLLLVAAIALVIMELKTPGLGIFGVAGLAAFILFFLVRSGWTDATLWPLGLFLTGAFLLIIEAVIMPGFIIPGAVGVLMILYSTWMAVAHPGETSLPPFPDLSQAEDSRAVLVWAGSMVGGLVGGFVVTITLGKMMHRLPFLNRLVLLPPRVAATAAAQKESAGRAAGATGWSKISVGEDGVAVTALRPSGVVRLGDRKIDVVTRGGFVEAGAPVRVVEVSGNRVIVRALETAS